VNEGLVTTRPTLIAWAEDMLAHGGGHTDAVLFAHAYRAAAGGDSARLANLAELAAALHPSRERRLESAAQGAAFRRIALASAPCASLDLIAEIDDDRMAYPIIVAVLAAGHEIALADALTAYLHGLMGNLVSAAQRLIPLGQTDAQIAIASLEGAVSHIALWAAALPPGDPLEVLGSATLMADFASLAHETQYTRLFRT
jgi:urease accessory protein